MYCQGYDQDKGKMRIIIQKIGNNVNQQEKDIWG